MNDTENIKEYEMSYLLTPDISEDKVDAEVAEFKKVITDNGGDIAQDNIPEMRRLAYPVKKQNRAYFGVVYFNIDTDGLDKIKKVLILYKKVLRYLILNKAAEIKQTATPVRQSAENSAPSAQSFDQRLESLLKS